MENKPDNCIIWGERDDVYKFIQAADLFFFSSKLELNPLVIKEALSYKLPIFMRKLNTYLDYYDNNFLVTYIDNDLEKTKQLLISHLK
jgi:glycosyltransferase involved in cell wall biosynthesis